MSLTRADIEQYLELLEKIEDWATACADTILGQEPSQENERLESIDLDGVVRIKKWIRGDWQYFEFPTEALYNDEVLIHVKQLFRLYQNQHKRQYKITDIEDQIQRKQHEMSPLEKLLKRCGIPYNNEGDNNEHVNP